MENIFKRPEDSYNIDFEKLNINSMLAYDASPISQIVKMIPDGSKILDIGCGNGILGYVLKAVKPMVIIDGCEPSQAAVSISKKHYRNVHNAYFQDIKDSLKNEEYDYIVLADVLEHVTDPQDFLEDVTAIFGPHTVLIIDIPNVAHYSVRLDLLQGKFSYVTSGFLERTHLRFFTLDTIKLMFNNMPKLSIREIYHLENTTVPRREGVLSGIIYYTKLRSELSAMTYQYLIVCDMTLNADKKIKEVVVKSKPNLMKRILRKIKK